MSVDPQQLDAGRQLHHAGQFLRAQEIYRQALLTDPDNPDLLNLMAAVCIDLEQWIEAATHLNEALRHDPNYPAAHENCGVLLAKQNRLPEAVAHFRRAAELNPRYAPTQNNLANALAQTGQVEEAVQAFQRLLDLAPDTPHAHEVLARYFFQQKRIPETIYHVRHLIRLQPDEPRWWFDLATCWTQTGQRAEAIEAYRQTLRLRPDSAESCVNLANLLAEDRELDQAVALYRQALQIRPEFAEALINLGRVLNVQKKFDEAVVVLQEAAVLKPELTAGYNNLGIALGELGRFDEAVAYYRQGLSYKPQDPDLWYNLGIAELKRGDVRQSLESFERAMSVKTDFAEAHHNHSAALLLLGQFADGLAEYEWRHFSRDFHEKPLRWPAWNGSDLSGRTIVLVAEQGLGDTLQFIRYAPLLQRCGARVVIECQKVLHPILARTAGVHAWMAMGDEPPVAVDCCTRIMSVPHWTKATLETIPAEVPYLFADPQLVDDWNRRLASYDGFRVGLVWQGNALVPGDRFRSIPLQRYAPLTEIAAVQLFSLQKGTGNEQLRDASKPWPIVDFGDTLDTTSGAFMDTAAIMKNLDLVITSDTATAHLAGGLGVPVWLAVPFVPDWRWLLAREDSPWYPTMRLFRQARLNDWSGVFERMAEALQSMAASSRAAKKL